MFDTLHSLSLDSVNTTSDANVCVVPAYYKANPIPNLATAFAQIVRHRDAAETMQSYLQTIKNDNNSISGKQHDGYNSTWLESAVKTFSLLDQKYDEMKQIPPRRTHITKARMVIQTDAERKQLEQVKIDTEKFQIEERAKRAQHRTSGYTFNVTSTSSGSSSSNSDSSCSIIRSYDDTNNSAAVVAVDCRSTSTSSIINSFRSSSSSSSSRSYDDNTNSAAVELVAVAIINNPPIGIISEEASISSSNNSYSVGVASSFVGSSNVNPTVDDDVNPSATTTEKMVSIGYAVECMLENLKYNFRGTCMKLVFKSKQFGCVISNLDEDVAPLEETVWFERKLMRYKVPMAIIRSSPEFSSSSSTSAANMPAYSENNDVVDNDIVAKTFAHLICPETLIFLRQPAIRKLLLSQGK
jgi:hypothetical protein